MAFRTFADNRPLSAENLLTSLWRINKNQCYTFLTDKNVGGLVDNKFVVCCSNISTYKYYIKIYFILLRMVIPKLGVFTNLLIGRLFVK